MKDDSCCWNLRRIFMKSPMHRLALFFASIFVSALPFTADAEDVADRSKNHYSPMIYLAKSIQKYRRNHKWKNARNTLIGGWPSEKPLQRHLYCRAAYGRRSGFCQRRFHPFIGAVRRSRHYQQCLPERLRANSPDQKTKNLNANRTIFPNLKTISFYPY